ncbi:transcriptional regulator [Bergeyella porcorum]|uniref:Transcriptional regulator n=1 Tax=Bergeyella porcorum TaxID=1735111 RepID=A0AAU0EZS5_9FLAO
MSNRILLVEDDQSFGAVLKDYLMINNFEVTLATDGEQGLKEFTENEFDICIFDVMMPKKDGFTLAEEVKKIDKNIPIIFLTAKNLREDILKGYQIGADDYITKPLIPNCFCIKSKPFCKEVLHWKRRARAV